MNERLREALRRKIQAHNRLVRLSTLSSVLLVAMMWGAIYFISRWIVLFGSTVVKGLEAAIPERFDRSFGIVVLVWLLAGLIAQRCGLFRTLRSEKSSGFVFLELLLAPPRATFGMLQNIRNLIRFSEADLVTATDFLVRVVRTGKIETTAVAVELPDETTRDRVIHALQLLDLIYLRQTEQASWYAVANPQRLLAFL